MSTDIARLTAKQLHSYASGYTDAREDVEPELVELRGLVQTLTAQLEEAEATAEQIYHDAYCGCRQQLARLGVRVIEIETARNTTVAI